MDTLTIPHEVRESLTRLAADYNRVRYLMAGYVTPLSAQMAGETLGQMAAEITTLEAALAGLNKTTGGKND